MTTSQIIIIICLVYMLYVFFLTWLSGRVAGIQPFPLSTIAAIFLAIMLNSWLTFSAFIHVPFLIKPLILVISGMITIGFFIDLSPGHILRAMAAGGFFILCQFLIFIFLLRKFWEATFFQVIKQFLFQNY